MFIIANLFIIFILASGNTAAQMVEGNPEPCQPTFAGSDPIPIGHLAPAWDRIGKQWPKEDNVDTTIYEKYYSIVLYDMSAKYTCNNCGGEHPIEHGTAAQVDIKSALESAMQRHEKLSLKYNGVEIEASHSSGKTSKQKLDIKSLQLKFIEHAPPCYIQTFHPRVIVDLLIKETWAHRHRSLWGRLTSAPHWEIINFEILKVRPYYCDGSGEMTPCPESCDPSKFKKTNQPEEIEKDQYRIRERGKVKVEKDNKK